jgi:hypothetical protein
MPGDQPGAEKPPKQVSVKPEDGGSDSKLVSVLGDLRVAFQEQSKHLVAARGDNRGKIPPEDKAVMDVLKSRMRPLNVKAADMAQELSAFFRPIDAYFELANLRDASSARQDKSRIILLESVMGEDCFRAMAGVPESTRDTYKKYKAAIEKRYKVVQDQVHVRMLLRQAAMAPDESTRDFVTRVWALVNRLSDLTPDARESEVVTSLRIGHSNEGIRDYLSREQPKTVHEAERLCDEYEARARVKPVTSKFVAAMASSSAQAVDNVGSQSGYRGPKARGRDRGRDRSSQGDNPGSGRSGDN